MSGTTRTKKIRGRYAPTPSGLLHLGNAGTALLAWLQIRQAGGEFVLRMEDIDRPRCRPEYARQMMDDLRWLGLDWDEGPDTGGPFAPYEQSRRTAWYEAALDKLAEAGRLYPCFCSRAQLQAVASAPHGLHSEGPAYPGTCRSLSAGEREKKQSGKTPSLRFAMPDEAVRFTDLAAGPQEFPGGAGGDFIVRRADGIFGYQLAVVVDDAAMEITDVLRGSDLLDSTPRQRLLFEALRISPPRYTHVPLLIGPDGQRLSKRHGSAALAAIREAGTPPETLTGYLAYWYGMQGKPEPVKPAELIGHFHAGRIPQSPVTLGQRELDALA